MTVSRRAEPPVAGAGPTGSRRTEMDEETLEWLLQRVSALPAQDLVRVARAVSQALWELEAPDGREQPCHPAAPALRIEIDQSSRAREVARITTAESFHHLHDRADELRRAHQLVCDPGQLAGSSPGGTP
jgi:hypothetical protein